LGSRVLAFISPNLGRPTFYLAIQSEKVPPILILPRAIGKLAHRVIHVALAPTPRGFQPRPVRLTHGLGDNLSWNNVILGTLVAIEINKDVEEILRDILFCFLIQHPFLGTPLRRLYLYPNAALRISIRCEDVNPSCVSERNRGDIAAPGEFSCNKVLAGRAAQTWVPTEWMSHSL